MASTRILGAAGLWTSPSLMQAPLGSFSQADNCVINNPGIVESRRGFEYLAYTFGISIDRAAALFSYRGTLLVQYAQKLACDTGVAFVDLAGTNGPPSVRQRMAGQLAGNNFYYTSSEGIKVLDQPIGATPLRAGVPPGPFPSGRSSTTTIDTTSTNGWLQANAQTAYVCTWLRYDASETPHEGDPSAALALSNAADLTIAPGAGSAVRGGDGLPAGAIGFSVSTTSQLFKRLSSIGTSFLVTYADVDAASFKSGSFVVAGVLGGAIPYYFDSLGAIGPHETTAAFTVSNGPRNVSVVITIPPELDTTYTVRTYRAYQSVGATVVPAPQYYLANEHQLTAGDLSSRRYAYSDTLPDASLQDPLYINTDDGDPPDSSLQNDNSQPPTALDLTQFDSRLWGAYYTEYQTMQLTLLGVGSPNGLQVGDTITIAGITYTGRAVGYVLTQTDFIVYTTADVASGLPSDSIRLTAQNFADVVTSNAASTVDCLYTAGLQDIFVGGMLLRARLPTTAAFSTSASRISAWAPVLPSTSTGDTATNGLWYSKQNQPEAVPLLNRMAIGPRNCKILRIKTLRDTLLVYTDIAGVWTVSNVYPYVITELSRTAELIAPASLSSFADNHYALTTQGSIKMNTAGPAVVDVAIERDIKALFGTGLPTLRTSAISVGYESDRKFILAMPTVPSDTYNTQALVYDVQSQAWTRWTKYIQALTIIPETDYLYVASPLNNRVSVERKNFDRTDYSDESFVVTVTAVSGQSVTLTNAAAVTAGDLLYVGPIAQGLITAVNTTTNVVTTQDSTSLVAGPATVYPGIQTTVTYSPLFSGAPESTKHYREVSYHFLTPAFSLGNALFSSDLNPAVISLQMGLAGFGGEAWAGFPFGQPFSPENKRAYVPTPNQRAAFLSVGFGLREARAQWRLMGYTATYEDMSERNTTK